MFTAQKYFSSPLIICPQSILICSKRSTPSFSDLDALEFWEVGVGDTLLVEVHPNPRGRIRCACNSFLYRLMIGVLMITETKLQQSALEGWLQKE